MSLTVVFMHFKESLMKYSINMFLSFKWAERLIEVLCQGISHFSVLSATRNNESVLITFFSFTWKDYS